MERNYLKSILFFIFLLLIVVPAHATIIGGPGPAGFGADNGIAYFTPLGGSYSLELLDVGGASGFPTTFGFYYADDPGTLIGIFGPEDQDPDPGGPGSVLQTAIIDYAAGKVYDADHPNFSVDPETSLQTTFIPGMGNIGFFHLLDLSGIGAGIFLLHTDPALNGDIDAAATFPSLTDPNLYLLGFEVFNPDINDFITVNVNIVSGLNPVPEPGTLFLLGSGIAGIAATRRKKNKR